MIDSPTGSIAVPDSTSPVAPDIVLSVVIVNWNTRDLLVRCLRSVYETAADLRLEVFVVDNASTDGSAGMVCARFPQVRLIENQENVGFARANNQAIRKSTGRFVLLLNSDTEVQPGALEHLVRHLEHRPKAGAAGPRMLNPDRTMQNSYGKLPSVWDEIVGPYLADFLTKPWGRAGSRYLGHQMQVAGCMPVDRVSFACTMIRREALDQVGLLDESFHFYSEDYDWFKRLSDAAWQVLFCPEAQVLHHWGASSGKRSDWALSQLYRSKRLYFRKHNGRSAETVLRAGLAVRFATKSLVAIAVWPLHQQEASLRWRQQVKLIGEQLRPLTEYPA